MSPQHLLFLFHFLFYIHAIHAVDTPSETIRVGVMLPLSGGSAEPGGIPTLAGLQAGFKLASEYLAGVKVEAGVVDDRSDKATGLFGALNLAENGTVVVLGPWNSAVAQESALVLNHQGINQIHFAVSYLLSNPSNYPSAQRLVPTQKTSVKAVVSAIQFFGWKRVGLVTTSDFYGQGFRDLFLTAAFRGNIQVDSEVSFSYIGADSRNFIRNILQQLRESRVYIIVVGAIASDTKVLLEEADVLGMLNERYIWIGDDGWGTNELFSDWPLVQKRPEAAYGLMAVTSVCNDPSPAYDRLLASLGLPSRPMRGGLSVFTCQGYDTALLAMTALNKTLAQLKEYDISPKCLEHPYFPNNRNACSIPTPEADRIFAAAICLDVDTSLSPVFYKSCSMCHLCHFMSQANGAFYRAPASLLKSHVLTTRFEGATGYVTLDKYGDRQTDGLPFGIFNSRPTSLTNSVPVFSLVALTPGNDHNETSSNFSQVLEPVFGGGNASSPNMVKPSDKPAAEYLHVPLGLQIAIGSLCTLGIILALICTALTFYYRNTKAMKSASPSLMYVIAFGAALQVAGALFLIPEVRTSVECHCYEWFTTIGHCLAISAIILKTYRIKKIFNSKETLNSVRYTNMGLFLQIAAITITLMAFLIASTLISIQKTFLYSTTYQNASGEYVEQIATVCVINWSNYVTYVVTSLALLFCSFLSFAVRKVPLFFNEAKWIMMISMNYFLITSLIFVVTTSLVLDQSARTLLRGLSSFLTAVPLLLCLWGPKFYFIKKGVDDRSHKSDSAHQNSGGSGHPMDPKDAAPMQPSLGYNGSSLVTPNTQNQLLGIVSQGGAAYTPTRKRTALCSRCGETVTMSFSNRSLNNLADPLNNENGRQVPPHERPRSVVSESQSSSRLCVPMVTLRQSDESDHLGREGKP